MTWDGKERRSKQREAEEMQKRVMKEAIKEWLDEQFTGREMDSGWFRCAARCAGVSNSLGEWVA